MEFIQEFAVVQGTLLTLQKRVGLLKNLSEDKKQIQTVVQSLIKTINSLGNADFSKDCLKLRQISLFLVLNSSLNVCELLVEDSNCGHLIDSAPTLSGDILISLFCEPVLNNYFCELIVYCPPLLGIELLEVAVRNLKGEHTSFTPSCAETFTTAIYVKLLMLLNESGNHKCEMDCVATKVMDSYTKFCEFFIDYSRITCEELSLEYLGEFGEMVLSSLKLVTSCLKYYVNPFELNESLLEVYKMNLTFDYTKWHQESDDKIFNTMHQQLFSLLVVQIARITVDIWLGWAELDSQFTSDYSLQQDVAESMYKCHEIIQESIRKGIESELLKGLVPMLSSMASKPRDEDDEIKEADIALIMKRIPDKSFCQKKWLMALLTKSEEVFTKEEYIECIEKNIQLMDNEVISVALEKMFCFNENSKGACDFSETVKHIILSAVRQLSLNEQLLTLEEIFDKYGMNTLLCTEEYNLNVTKIFNSAVDPNEVCHDERYIEFVNLSLQNPLDVIKRLLKQGVASDKQAQIMADIIQILHPFHSLHVDKNSQDSCGLLIRILSDIMQDHCNMEFSGSSFISLVTLLATSKVLLADDFLKFNVFPLLHNSLMKQNWLDVTLWLETLQIFVDGTVKPCVSVDASSLLLTLAQIMELSRKNVYSFSCAALVACEHAIKIVNIVLESFSADEGESIISLRDNIMSWTSPINLFYFFSLWSKCGSCPLFTSNWKVYLLHWIHMEKCNLQPPWSSSSDLPRKKLVFELMQLLPICVQNEWRTIIQNLLNIMSPSFCEISSTFVFECLIDVVQIVALMCTSPYLTNQEQDCALSCLDFCIRNFSVVVKEELTGKPHSMSPAVASGMLQKIVHLNLALPGIIQESCAGLLLNMQVDIIACIASDMQIYVNEDDDEERQLIKFQCDEVLKDVCIGIMMVKDLKARQALARKLQEGLGEYGSNLS